MSQVPPPPPPPPPGAAPGDGSPRAVDEPFSEQVDLRDPSAAGAFRVPFSVLDAFVALLAYFVGQLFAGLLFGVGAAILGSELETTTTLVVGVGAQVLGLALAVGYLLARRRLTWRVLGPVPPGWLGVALGLAVGLGGTVTAYLLNGVLTYVFQPDTPVEQQLLRDVLAGGWATWLAVIAAVLVAPVAEELLFRGLLFQALRRRLGLWMAAGFSAVVFAGVHVEVLASQPLALAGLVWLGIVFAWAFHRTGTLVVPVIAHATFNAISLGLAIAADRLDLDRLAAIGMG